MSLFFCFFFPASLWESPSRLRPPDSDYDLGDSQQSIRRGGSTHSLQLDCQVLGGGREQGWEGGKRSFQWERNQSGEWERRRILDRDEKRKQKAGAGNRTRDRPPSMGHDSGEDTSSPVYEEYQECSPDLEQGEDTENPYDTLPPTRRAYEGYPSSPAGLNLHPAQLLPPLRAWDLQTGEWREPQADPGGQDSCSVGGSGDELERLLNLVSLRARRATRINRDSTGSEPTTGWDGFK